MEWRIYNMKIFKIIGYLFLGAIISTGILLSLMYVVSNKYDKTDYWPKTITVNKVNI